MNADATAAHGPTEPGFTYRYRDGGGEPTRKTFPVRLRGRLSAGDMLNFEAGEVDLGANGDHDLLGSATETKAGEASVTRIEVIVDGDAVYGVVDGSVRAQGDRLSVNGDSGGQGVHASTGGGLEVVVDCRADEETLVRIFPGHHHPSAAPSDRAELNVAIARAAVRIQSQHAGRGPGRAHAFFNDRYLVIVLEDTLTKLERSLVAGGRTEAVIRARRELQAVISPELVGAIEDLTGARVRAFVSDANLDPDLSIEFFALDRRLSA